MILIILLGNYFSQREFFPGHALKMVGGWNKRIGLEQQLIQKNKKSDADHSSGNLFLKAPNVSSPCTENGVLRKN